MVSRIRLLLACLLMLALPLQGMAAASMLFCGMGQEAATQVNAGPAHTREDADAAAHGDGHGNRHSDAHADAHGKMHGQADAHDQSAMHSHAQDGAQANAVHTHTASTAARAGHQTGHDSGHVSGHKCNVCATCCQAAAIAGFSAPVQLQPLPQADLAEPFVLIHARASAVPDKPPRLARI